MILVAIPAHDSRVHVETMRAVSDERLAAREVGIDLRVVFAPGCSVLPHARNALVREFLELNPAPDDRLVFVDGDISFPLGSILKLAASKPDFVGGCYPYKADEEGYPIEWLKDLAELWADPETGLLEVSSLPGGFIAVRPSVFEQLRAKFSNEVGFRYPFCGKAFEAFFYIPRGGGEDGAFCADYRATGGKIWLDPEIAFGHHEGTRAYHGHIGNWLRSRIPTKEAA
jgi:hypothetical protein